MAVHGFGPVFSGPKPSPFLCVREKAKIQKKNVRPFEPFRFGERSAQYGWPINEGVTSSWFRGLRFINLLFLTLRPWTAESLSAGHRC